ncbi:hypothetical protein AAC387_Pa07g2486 [Persea americana]
MKKVFAGTYTRFPSSASSLLLLPAEETIELRSQLFLEGIISIRREEKQLHSEFKIVATVHQSADAAGTGLWACGD